MARKSRKPARPRAARGRNTADRAQAAAERLLANGGYAAVSMDVIARSLGIRTPSLYHHFPGGKEQLVLAVAERRAIEDGLRLRERMQSSSQPVDKLRAVAHYFANLSGHHVRHALSESRRELSPAARARMQSRFADHVETPLIAVIEDAIARRQFRPCDPVAAVRAFLMLMLSLGEFEADDPLRDRLPDFLVDLFVDGLRVHEARRPARRKPAAGRRKRS